MRLRRPRKAEHAGTMSQESGQEPEPTEELVSPPPSIRSRAIRGGSVLAVGTTIERLARLARNMLLARLIAPDQFGTMALILAVTGLFAALTEVGIPQAVVQNKRGNTPEFLNVAWWFGVIRGVLVASAGVALSPVISAIYGLPELTPLLSFAFIGMIVGGLISPRVYSLQREFRFSAMLWTTVGSGIIATGVTLVVGLYMHSVWALVIGAVSEALIGSILSFILCPIRPSLKLDPESRRDLFQFTRGMAGLPILNFAIMQADVFVLGKVASTELLGLYSMAISVAGFPLTIFNRVALPLVIPVVSTVQENLAEVRSMLLRLSRLVWLLGLPMATVMALCADPLLVLVYGRPEFTLVGSAFGLYGLMTVVYMASLVIFSMYLAIGRPSLNRRFTITRAALVVVSMYPLAHFWGGFGAALSLLIALIIAMIVQLVSVRQAVGMRIREYAITLRAGIIISVVVAVPISATLLWIRLPNWVDVLIGAGVGAIAWAASLLHENREIQRMRAASSIERPFNIGSSD